MDAVQLLGLETELPGEAVSDAELAAMLACSEDAVAGLSQGKLRHHAPDGTGPSHLACSAAERLLKRLALEPADIDLLVFATNTPDFFFPGSACLLQDQLGCRAVPCLDVRSGCTDFLAALDVSRRYVAVGRYQRVLLATAEVSSHQNRFDGESPELACLMGDGAAVALLQKGDSGLSVEACSLVVDGSRKEDYWCEFPASRHVSTLELPRACRMPAEKIAAGAHFPLVDLAAMRELALHRLPEALDAALAEAGLSSVDATVVAHLDPVTAGAVGEQLGDKAGRIIDQRHAYILSAALPMALADLLADGQLQPGQSLALLTAGSGASWGAAVVKV
ncbi:MAG TPA: hypothetical protein EYG16_02125 [Deltaproteobacteria bacterium]|nr:hypothetical protein [Deltaproteobacteria bacterium]